MNLDGFIKLPDPGGYLYPSSFKPCSQCGEPVFDVVFCEREIRQEGNVIYRETVDVQCPTCPLLSDRTVKANWKIGSLDNRSGELKLIESSPVGFPTRDDPSTTVTSRQARESIESERRYREPAPPATAGPAKARAAGATLAGMG